MTEHVNGVAVDLSGFMLEDSAVLDILSPDGMKNTGWKIQFAGPSHPKSVEWANEASRRQLRRDAQLEAQQRNSRKVKVEEREPDEVRRENVGWVVARIIGWSPPIKIPSIQAEPIEFSSEAATKLLVRPDMGWAFSQMVEYLASERSFSKASATN